ncbi:hypothetical protein I7I53_01968 [Histoplasma capsulatum var. duboisii H88]|uniref:Uncharacterized protein n=1 Tax=Ajellomyces capsulatus (strain H88) TaxID=544711 RepID=A0A8A1LJ97_AJEC8|nr:hypothetical protein I7I53_01968 [Histoplasma capsulatum var. duboisii H88]
MIPPAIKSVPCGWTPLNKIYQPAFRSLLLPPTNGLIRLLHNEPNSRATSPCVYYLLWSHFATFLFPFTTLRSSSLDNCLNSLSCISCDGYILISSFFYHFTSTVFLIAFSMDALISHAFSQKLLARRILSLDLRVQCQYWRGQLLRVQ